VKTRTGSGRVLPLAGLLVAVVMTSLRASAQVSSPVSNVSVSAAVQQSISVSVGLGTVDFNLFAGDVANGDDPIPVTTSWNLNPGLVSEIGTSPSIHPEAMLSPPRFSSAKDTSPSRQRCAT